MAEKKTKKKSTEKEEKVEDNSPVQESDSDPQSLSALVEPVRIMKRNLGNSAGVPRVRPKTTR